MSEQTQAKVYDLEERTLQFARRVRLFVKSLPRTVGNFEDSKQVIRSSGSIEANYIEANESLSAKDRVMRMKIARKEAKETRYWLRLVDVGTAETTDLVCRELIQEASELMNILGAILRKLDLPRE